jgi:hypothetical protein
VKAEAEKDPQLEAKKREFTTWYAEQKAKVAELLGKAKNSRRRFTQAISRSRANTSWRR